MLIAEDINPYLGCYGDSIAKSPTIDSLAAQGIRFDRMYSPVGVCAPSRSALMTGMFPTSIGTNHMRTGGGPLAHPFRMPSYQVILPEGMKAFTEYMRAAGYFCTNNRKTDYQFKNQLSFWDESSNEATWEHRPKDKPFFSVFTYLESHESRLWESKNDTLWVKPGEVTPPPYLLNDSIGKRDYAIMYSNIYRMDQRVRSEIDKIKKEGLLNNTIIIFMSDNGGPMPRQKRSLYERGTRIPFVVVFPDGSQAGTNDDRMLNMADIPPTILSLAGIKPPGHMEGKAFLGDYAENSGRDYVFSIRERMDADYDKQISVRDENYRYVRNYLPHQPEYLDIGYRLNLASMRKMLEIKNDLNKAQASWFTYPRPKEELYYTSEDEHEMTNLAGDPDYKDILDEMRLLADEVEEEYWPYKDLTEYELIDKIGNTGDIQVAKPSVNIEGNKVTLSSSTEGASFVYQINGDGNKDSYWGYYIEPISLKKGDNLKVIATRAGYEQSEMLDFTFL
ncbi:sulfatase-like hydrolase/transferase [Gramella jeungdoensis]|uniref:Sulfatase-like hydrolase/transferase n=1 Tax=Gramella jeungdoensis TaxID=708091 RepID=A0ABT0Z0U7_9FLAO|nr:sulfatase-like hydrolase/transferase [Gramella jeungdoensis]MCM8569020.1 sulfatase-like hydrolase/transferase [Gramella jeungdoensis]